MGEIIARPLPPVPLGFTGERLTSDYGGQTEIEHMHRYLLAREWCRGKDVLDVASGEGYGTAMLAQVARSATGVEIAPDAVAHAAGAYPADNLRFMAGDAVSMPLADASFDVVVSFETVEHFAQQSRFMSEIRRVLRPDGLLIISTPDRDHYSPAETPANPYHVRELTGAEFDLLLREQFAHSAVLLQRPVFGSVMLPAESTSEACVCFERRGERHFERSSGLARPQYLVALASNATLPVLPPSVYVDTGRLGMLNPAQAEAMFQSSIAALETQARALSHAAELAGSEKQQLEHDVARLAAELQSARERADSEAAVAGAGAAEIASCRAELQSVRAEAAASAGAQAASCAAELDAVRDHARSLADELASCRAQLQARAAGTDALQSELQACRAELGEVRGEAKGLLVANEFAERACAALRAELAGRSLADTENAAARAVQAAQPAAPALAQFGAVAQGDLEQRVWVLQQELKAAREEAALARDWSDAYRTSASWRLTAPIRAASRALLRKP